MRLRFLVFDIYYYVYNNGYVSTPFKRKRKTGSTGKEDLCKYL